MVKKKTTTKAVIYARFSPRKNAGECESIVTQIDSCGKYCEFHKLAVIGDFADSGLTGANDNRPGLQKALGLACAERAVLVVYSLSRLSRSTKDAIRIADDLSKAHADLCSVTEKIDTTTAYGKFFFVLMAAMGELERNQVSERTSAAMRYHQANGRRMSAVLPFGWQADADDPARMLPHEDELATIAEIQKCRQEGMAYRAIAAHLEGRKMYARNTRKKFKGRMRTVRGTWYPKTIQRILQRVEVEAG